MCVFPLQHRRSCEKGKGVASTNFNPYPTSGTAWHHRKMVYGHITEDAGSSVSWWIGLDRTTFQSRAQEAVGLRAARGPRTIADVTQWADVGELPE